MRATMTTALVAIRSDSKRKTLTKPGSGWTNRLEQNLHDGIHPSALLQ